MDKELFSRYEEKSKYNDIDSLLKLGDHYLEVQDYQHAYSVLSKFHILEDKEGYRKLAYLYQNGLGVATNIEEAKKLYKRGYMLGDIISGYNLALIYYREKNYAEALPYLAFCKYNGHLASTRLLGDMYRLGLGVEKNNEIAINLYEEAVAMGDISLFDQIGIIYYQDEKYLEAFSYFEKGANKLNKNSLYHLGICYSKGQGTYLDMQKAIYYFELAAKHGDDKSLYNLTIIYERGIGVTADKEKSRLYLERYQNYKKLEK